MEEEEASVDELFDKAGDAIQAAAEQKGSVADARATFFEISHFRPKGMENDGSEDTVEKIYGAAANSFKMAIDALEGDQFSLALSYLKVGRIKLEKAREA